MKRISLRQTLLGAVMALAAVPFAAHAAEGDKWAPYAELELKPGNDRFVGKLDYFRPLQQNDDTLVYALLRAVLDDNDAQEGNLGFGVRHLSRGENLNAIFGAYGFYDLRSSSLDHTFRQFTLGAEMLTENFEARANVYRPQGKVYGMAGGTGGALGVSGTQVIRLAGSTAEFALPGYDIEGGVRFDLDTEATATPLNLGLYAAYYHFDRRGVEVEGPRGRVELMWDNPFNLQNATMTVGGEISDDDVRNNTSYGFARLRVPFGDVAQKQQALSVLERRMTRRVIRDTDIVTGQKETSPLGGAGAPVLDTKGNEINIYFVVADGDGDCTREDPCNIEGVLDTYDGESLSYGWAGRSDLVVALADDGDIEVSETLLLPAYGQLIGGGGDPTNDGAGAGTANIIVNDGMQSVLALTDLGARPEIRGVDLPFVSGASTVLLAVNRGNTVVDGIGLSNANVMIGALQLDTADYVLQGAPVTLRNLYFHDIAAGSVNRGVVAILLNATGDVNLSNTLIDQSAASVDAGGLIGVELAMADGATATIDRLHVRDLQINGRRDVYGVYMETGSNEVGVLNISNSRFENLSAGEIGSEVSGIYIEGATGLSVNNTVFENFYIGEDTEDTRAIIFGQSGALTISGSENSIANVDYPCRVALGAGPITGTIDFQLGGDCPPE